MSINRYAAEGLMIVASILLAFSIQAWWEVRQDRVYATDVLTGILEELLSNEAILDRNTKFHMERADMALSLLTAAANDAREMDEESVDFLLAGVSSWTIPAYERAALDTALTRQELAVLDDSSLVRGLAAFQRLMERTLQVEAQDEYHSREVWMPLMRRLTNLPQVYNVGADRYPDWQGSRNPVADQQDHRDLLLNREIVNALVEKRGIHEDILVFQDQLRAALRELVQDVQGALRP